MRQSNTGLHEGLTLALACCRFVKLPWEENPDFFTDSLPPSARNFVADLLQRSPEARKPIRTVLHSPLFTGDAQVTPPFPSHRPS